MGGRQSPRRKNLWCHNGGINVNVRSIVGNDGVKVCDDQIYSGRP